MKSFGPVPLPKGYFFGVCASAMRYKDRDDLMCVVSEEPAVAAGLFTTNRFAAAPVQVCREIIASRKPVRAVLINAGQANACTGDDGLRDCRESLALAGKAFSCAPNEILPASTGVIGQPMNMPAMREAIPRLAQTLGKTSPVAAAKAIMTTDTFPKLSWGEVEIDGARVRLLGMAKGAGMICPNMATMLSLVICDAAVDPEWWTKAAAEAVNASFNSVSVDGDTSTNDSFFCLANGASGVKIKTQKHRDALLKALTELCEALSYMLVEDGEGATKVIAVKVRGADTNADAERIARAVGHSPLVKTAMFGRDANWGRIVCAAGYAGVEFDPNAVRLSIGGVPVFEDGQPVPGDLDALLAPIMRRTDIPIRLEIGSGSGQYTLLASDLSYDYVKINADYRS